MLRIAAFQAVDPGSTPGRRNVSILSTTYHQRHKCKHTDKHNGNENDQHKHNHNGSGDSHKHTRKQNKRFLI